MAEILPIELAGDDDVPKLLRNRNATDCKMRSHVRTILLSGQAAIAAADTIKIGVRPKGSRFRGVKLSSGVSLGAATIAIGIAGNTGKYRAAATFTAVDTPTESGVTAAKGVETTADEDVFATIAVAALPTSAHYLVIEYFYSID